MNPKTKTAAKRLRPRPRTKRPKTAATGAPYAFEGGFPTAEAVQAAYDEADFCRAVQAYRFFYPSVSGLALLKGNEAVGLIPNEVFGILDTQPRHVMFTSNSDTPYGMCLLDLRAGPIVVELPPGPLIGLAFDIHQRWVADMGIPGPDAGKGGKHLILPPEYEGPLPAGFDCWKSSTYRLLLGVRSLPEGGDVEGALERIRQVKVRPLSSSADWRGPRWIDVSGKPMNVTPLDWEDNLDFWRSLHEIIDKEPPYESYRAYYGELAALGLVKGRPFDPPARMRLILGSAAQIGNAQMRVQAFAGRRPERVAWPDLKWEWAALRPENGFFEALSFSDLEARETWFFQAIGASPAMFRRQTGAGSLYWLGLRDKTGAYLDGAKTYRLRIPQPVPASLFWSLTVYDALTRSQIHTQQGKAALRSLFELKDASKEEELELSFAPQAPAGDGARWIQTIPGRGWFAYLRLYGPEQAAFNGAWRPDDFEEKR